MLRLVITVLFVLLLVNPAVAQWEMPEFLILMWRHYGIWDEDDEAKVQALAKTGCNVVMLPSNTLELCRKYGLKLLVMDASPNVASRLSGDPAVWGYYLQDEPTDDPICQKKNNIFGGPKALFADRGKLDMFPALAEEVKAYRKADPHHLPYINMLNRDGDFLRRFIRIVSPDLLSFDYYQWFWGSAGHFPTLEYHREAALAAKIPLVRFLTANASQNNDWGGDRSPPFDNLQKLRQSVYTSLAYGVKGIEWFNARLTGMFVPGTTELGPCGKDVAAINAELRKLGPILMKLRSVDVFHTRPLPRGTREVPKDYWVHALSGRSSGIVMGIFKDDKNNDFIMVANRNVNHERQTLLHFMEPVKEVNKFNKRTGEWDSLTINDDVIDVIENNRIYRWALAIQRFVHGSDFPINKLRVGTCVEFSLSPGDGELLRVKR